MRYLRDKRGTSVIEVLVVMVVLLVGILTVVRLFPPGFASVRRAEAMTLAGRLGQQEMERWENNPSNLPEGVVPVGGTPLAVLNDLYPGPPVTNDNAVAMRRVLGETVRIPFGGWSIDPGTSGSIYMLSFGPVDVDVDQGSGMIIQTAGKEFAVRGGALTRRIMNSGNTDFEPWDTLSQFQYAVDYDDMKIAFPGAGNSREYWISCSWWEQQGSGAPEYRSATNVRVYVPANTARWLSIGGPGADVVLPVPSGASVSFDSYSESVSRGFVQMPTGSGWSTDPYEYQLINPALGVISFNPLGYARKEFGRPLEARVDYSILDLEIIREDKRVPAQAPFRVNLTLNRVKQVGVTRLDDGSAYEGINTNIKADLVAVDLETCREADLSGATVNYKEGIIDLPETVALNGVASPVPTAGRNFRFLYKAEGDWSLQFHKAYSIYTRADSNTPLAYDRYAVAGSRIWFAACNSNNTIAVTYEWNDGGIPRKVVGECYRTSDSLDSGPIGTQWTYFDLKHDPTRIFSVNGVSARVRVIWRDSDRWRNVDLDTTLMRKSDS